MFLGNATGAVFALYMVANRSWENEACQSGRGGKKTQRAAIETPFTFYTFSFLGTGGWANPCFSLKNQVLRYGYHIVCACHPFCSDPFSTPKRSIKSNSDLSDPWGPVHSPQPAWKWLNKVRSVINDALDIHGLIRLGTLYAQTKISKIAEAYTYIPLNNCKLRHPRRRKDDLPQDKLHLDPGDVPALFDWLVWCNQTNKPFDDKEERFVILPNGMRHALRPYCPRQRTEWTTDLPTTGGLYAFETPISRFLQMDRFQGWLHLRLTNQVNYKRRFFLFHSPPFLSLPFLLLLQYDSLP